MNENPLNSIFSRVRDQYSAAVRWKYLAVILLLLIHLLTIGPFIELSREKSKTEPKIKMLSEVKSKIEGLGFEDLKIRISNEMETQLTKFVENLRFDFKCLDLTVQDLRKKDQPESELPREGDSPLGYIGTRESALAAERSSRNTNNGSNMALQMGRGGSAGKIVRPLKITDPNVLKNIEFWENRDEMLKALKPFVDPNIIEPRYSELNDYWKYNLLPEIQKKFEKLTKDVNDLKSEFPERLDEWEKLSKAFEKANSAASKLKFKPPIEQLTEPPFWWSSEDEKKGVKIELKDMVMRQVEEPAVLTSLREQVTQLFIEEEEWGEKIDKDMEKLKVQFEEQEKKLGSIAKTLQFLALDLESVMVIFPLLLGLILAGATAWTTLRLRELGWTIHLMIKDGADQHLWDWYCAQVFLLLPKFSSNITKQHNSLLIRKSIGLCAMSWIWIGITAWRLYGISEITPVRLFVVTCIGATVAALAQVHHYVVINSTLSLKGEQAASVATSSQE